MRNCPDCSTPLDDQATFCDNCGLRLSPAGAGSPSDASPPVAHQPAAVQPPNFSQQAFASASPGTCSACGYMNIAGEMFCDNCGVMLSPVASVPPPPPTPVDPPKQQVSAAPAGVCANCGYPNKPGDQFCDNCGSYLSSTPSPARSQQTPAAEPPAGSPQSAPAPGKISESGVCPSCGEKSPAGEAFCMNCGYQLGSISYPLPVAPPVAPSSEWPPAAPAPAPGSVCPNCGYPNAAGESFCDQCGLQLPAAGMPPPPSEPKPVPAPPSAPPAVSSPAPASAAQVCMNCGYPRNASEMFCDNCGMKFSTELHPASTPSPAQPSAPPSVEPPRSPVHEPAYIFGKLVVLATQAEISLPSGKTELLIGRSDPVRNVFPDIDLTIHGGDSSGVSRKHARLTVQGSQVYIEDLNSTNFTFLNKQRLLPGQSYPLNNDDEIRLGLLAVAYRTN